MKNHLRDILEDRGITQRDFARQIKMSPAQLSRIVATTNCTVHTAHRIAAALDVAIEDVWER